MASRSSCARARRCSMPRRIDDYVRIIKEGNNGGYANDWLIGDRKTGEIAYLELGLEEHSAVANERWILCQLEFSARSEADSRGDRRLRSERCCRRR